ncbi:serine hydrolase [candidate division WOR-3 bacterium]|nr:serine hydrolase [candidate division WOR-3 bacterium]
MSGIKRILRTASKIKNLTMSCSFETPPGHKTIALNQNKILHSASLMKLPLMASLYSMNSEGSLSLSFSVTPKIFFQSYIRGKTFTVERTLENRPHSLFELTEKMITVSDNQAACVLMDFVPKDRLDKTLKDTKMKRTSIVRKVMDIPAHERGIDNTTTSSDICRFYRYLFFGEGMGFFPQKNMMELLKSQKFNQRIPSWILRKWQIAHKTGTIENHVYDAGIVFSDPPTIFAVLLKGCDIESGERIIRSVLHDYFSDSIQIALIK